jgi:hypothetical protein
MDIKETRIKEFGLSGVTKAFGTRMSTGNLKHSIISQASAEKK